MIIFVPSKGRAVTSALLRLAQVENVALNVVVENQEYGAYKREHPDQNYHVLPLSHQGITYARNWIKRFATANGLENIWMLDDDISAVYMRAGTKLNKAPLTEVLRAAQQQFTSYALAALEYRQFAWSATKPLIQDSFCDACVYINTKLTKDIQYRSQVEGKEDRDFAMQIIAAGMHTARTTLYAFSNPPNGSNAGGLKEIFYDAGKESACADALCAAWPNATTRITKPDGRPDVKINWEALKPQPLQHKMF